MFCASKTAELSTAVDEAHFRGFFIFTKSLLTRKLFYDIIESMIVQFTEEDDFTGLDITHDLVFKSVFTKDNPQSRGALSALISASIGRKVRVNFINENEPAPESLIDRQLRYDINCTSENGETFNVEMTMNADTSDAARCEFHMGKLFTSQNIQGVGKDFRNLKRAYQVSIFANRKLVKGEPMNRDTIFLHRFEYYDSLNKISLGGLTQIVTIELDKLGPVLSKEVDEMDSAERWSVFLKYMNNASMRCTINKILEKDKEVAMAGQVLLGISRDHAQRLELISQEMAELTRKTREHIAIDNARKYKRLAKKVQQKLANAEQKLANAEQKATEAEQKLANAEQQSSEAKQTFAEGIKALITQGYSLDDAIERMLMQ